MVLKASEVGEKLGAKVLGDPNFIIEGVSAPQTAHSSQACFIEAENYLPQIAQSHSQCWVTSQKLFDQISENDKTGKVFLLTEKPYLSYIKLVEHFFPAPKAQSKINPQAFIDPTAKVDPSAQIDAFVSVGARAVIGAGVILGSGVWIGDDAQVGKDSILYSGVKIYPRCIVGERNILHAGCIIGSDGFGFLPTPTGLAKIPQVGRAITHNNVEIGANTTVDRGTLGDTVIGAGSKIDNLVQIGHNCQLGQNSVLCAFVGLSGNTTLGNNVLIAGQSGTKGHLKIGDNVQVAAQSGVSKDIPANSKVKGYPAQNLNDFLKLQTIFLKLPEIYKRLISLEKKHNALHEGDDQNKDSLRT